MIFFVNGPIGAALVLATLWLMPAQGKQKRAQLDLASVLVLFAGLTLLVGPLLFGHELGWPQWSFVVMGVGAVLLAAFPRLEQSVERRGGSPLIEPGLLADSAFVRGLIATFCFFLSNISFYFLVTLFMQTAMGLSALDAGFVMVPLTVAFVIAARRAGAPQAASGIGVLFKGCVVQAGALAGLVALVGWIGAPSMFQLMVPLTIFGYGQRLVMAQLFSTVLRSIADSRAGSASGVLVTAQQVANAAGVAVVGLVYFGAFSARCADCGADHVDRHGDLVCRVPGVASPLPSTRWGTGGSAMNSWAGVPEHAVWASAFEGGRTKAYAVFRQGDRKQ